MLKGLSKQGTGTYHLSLLELHVDSYMSFVISHLHFSRLPIRASAYLNGGVGANQIPHTTQARKSHGMLHS